MKSIGALSILLVSSLVFLVAPVLVMADTPPPPPAPITGAGGLIPCAGPDCNFGHLVTFANTIITTLLEIAIPLSAALFSYAGFLYLTSNGNPSKKSQANKVFQSVFWGFVLALSAWLLVSFITNLFGYGNAGDVFKPKSAPSSMIINQTYEIV